MNWQPQGIGVFALIPISLRGPMFHAIECKRGRGIILPGGKWEPGELYHQTAIRETEEEMGLRVTRPVFFHFGANTDGYLCYTFQCDLTSSFQQPVETAEGKPVEACWDDLVRGSKFGPYMAVLSDIWRRR
jgi:8-oxo-dGTP pyrophosphatase MutT (NUDIX family)